MLNVRLAGDHQYWKLLITWLSLVMSLVVYFMLSFSHEMSWMRSGTELSQFLKVFLPNFVFEKLHKYNTYTVHDKGFGRKLIGSCVLCTNGEEKLQHFFLTAVHSHRQESLL